MRTGNECLQRLGIPFVEEGGSLSVTIDAHDLEGGTGYGDLAKRYHGSKRWS